MRCLRARGRRERALETVGFRTRFLAWVRVRVRAKANPNPRHKQRREPHGPYLPQLTPIGYPREQVPERRKAMYKQMAEEKVKRTKEYAARKAAAEQVRYLGLGLGLGLAQG